MILMTKLLGKKKKKRLYLVKVSYYTAPHSGPAPSIKTALKCAERRGFKKE